MTAASSGPLQLDYGQTLASVSEICVPAPLVRNLGPDSTTVEENYTPNLWHAGLDSQEISIC